jgi:GT2 family glycosyltransferase
VTPKPVISSDHNNRTTSKGQEFPLVSVVITGHNERDTIEMCISSLFQQTYPNLEIIYIDSKSSDGTYEIAIRLENKSRCQQNCKRYLALSLEQANSPAKGRNYGVKIASGSIIAFTDADCIPETNWLENLIRQFSRDTRVVGGPNVLKHLKRSKILDAIDNVLGTYLASGGSAQFMKIDKPSYVRALSTSNMAIERKLFWEIGGFDESLRYNEDSDLGYKLRKKGHRVLYTPEAKVNHFIGIESYFDFLGVLKEYGYERGRNVIRKPWLLTRSTLFSVAYIFAIIVLLTTSLVDEIGLVLALFLILFFFAIVFVASAELGARMKSPLMLVMGPAIYISIYFVYNSNFILGYIGEVTKIIKGRLKSTCLQK